MGNHSLIPGSMQQCLLSVCMRPSQLGPAFGYGLLSGVAEFSSSTASAAWCLAGLACCGVLRRAWDENSYGSVFSSCTVSAADSSPGLPGSLSFAGLGMEQLRNSVLIPCLPRGSSPGLPAAWCCAGLGMRTATSSVGKSFSNTGFYGAVSPSQFVSALPISNRPLATV